MIRIVLSTLIALFALTGCHNYTPKPLGDNRIDRGEFVIEKYVFPAFTFQYPNVVRIDTLISKSPNEYWFNIVYPEYNATIYCTYLSITERSFSKVLEDSYHLAYRHSLKADGINQMIYSGDKSSHLGGALYEIDGSVATPFQFFVTDSTSNFLRGSLYYTEKVSIDSVAPISSLIKDDIMRLISSIRFTP